MTSDPSIQHADESLLLAHAMGQLEGEDAIAVKEHIDQCATCREMVLSFRAVGRVARSSERVPTSFASHRMKRQITESLTAGRQRVAFHRLQPAQVAFGFFLAMGAGAAIAAVSIAGWQMAFQKQPSISHSKNVERVQTESLTEMGPDIGSKVADDGAAVSIKTVSTDKPGHVELSSLSESEQNLDSLGRQPQQASRKVVLEDAQKWPKKRADLARATHLSQPSKRSRVTASPDLEKANAKSQAAETLAEPTVSNPETDRETAPRVDLRAGAERLKQQAASDGSSKAPWLEVGDAFALAGDADEAADAFVKALGTNKGYISAGRLFRLVAEDLLPSADILRRVETDRQIATSAEGMRLLCSWKLKENGDKDAVETCARFARQHPKHPAMRIHILAAGRIAESRLNDCQLAIKQYSTAILVSQYAGISSTEAIFSRARCFERLGMLEDARKDLELYLSIERTAVWRQEVAELMQRLNLTAQPEDGR